MEKARSAFTPIASLLTGNPRTVVSGYDYLTGLRGFITISSFLWTFLIAFAPATVKNSNNIEGSGYQHFLRKIFSVIFWNEGLLYSSIILLSARVVALPFFISPGAQTLASAVFRRTANLVLPVAIILGVVTLTFSQTGVEYIWDYKTLTNNFSIQVPYQLPSALAYFNAVFNLFWTTTNFSTQAAATAFPSGTLWLVNVVYSQSYTIYMTMLVIPFTRPKWRVQAFILFIITAWWVQSWAWYSITGLLLADAVANMDFKAKSQRGIKIWRSIRIPSWVIYAILIAAGLVMQYLWTAWRPEFENYELQGHTGLYYTGGLNTAYDVKQPQARDDNYLILLGSMLMLETSDFLQWIFENSFFMYLGRRSYSIFLTQSILMYTIGIKLYTQLNVHRSVPYEAAVVVCFFVCAAATGVCAEILHRVVDLPMRRGAVLAWSWMRE